LHYLHYLHFRVRWRRILRLDLRRPPFAARFAADADADAISDARFAADADAISDADGINAVAIISAACFFIFKEEVIPTP
jgi:hypothetical protein